VNQSKLRYETEIIGVGQRLGDDTSVATAILTNSSSSISSSSGSVNIGGSGVKTSSRSRKESQDRRDIRQMLGVYAASRNNIGPTELLLLTSGAASFAAQCTALRSPLWSFVSSSEASDCPPNNNMSSMHNTQQRGADLVTGALPMGAVEMKDSNSSMTAAEGGSGDPHIQRSSGANSRTSSNIPSQLNSPGRSLTPTAGHRPATLLTESPSVFRRLVRSVKSLSFSSADDQNAFRLSGDDIALLVLLVVLSR
jgi:hypothetical protein